MPLHNLYYQPAPGEQLVPVEFEVPDDELYMLEDAIDFGHNRTLLSRFQHRWKNLVKDVKDLAA